MTAVTLAPHRCLGTVGNLVVTTLVVLLFSCRFLAANGPVVAGLLVGNHIVDASSLVIFVLSSGVNVF